MYEVDPNRGCGSKKNNAFYLEGVINEGEAGDIYSWTWCLGDGLDDLLLIDVPPRQEVAINPAGCIVTGELVRLNERYMAVTHYEEDFRKRIEAAVPPYGMASHVGKKQYSAVSFAYECEEYGPSRRVTKQTALKYLAMMRQMKESGLPPAFPIMFTHPRVPLFESMEQVDKLFRLGTATFYYNQEWMNTAQFHASWHYDDWGLYKRHNQDAGYHSGMIPILQLVDLMDKDGGTSKGMKTAREIMFSLEYAEQVIGFSWITQVSYTLPEDGRVDPDLLQIPGLNIINLEAL